MRLSEGKILVTGGAGLIGSAVVWALNCLDLEDIIVCDRLSNDDRYKNLIPLGFHDYVDADDLLTYLKSPEGTDIKTIFHLGACANTAESDCRFLMKNNFEFTKNLAQYTVERGIRFVYASSAATYGDGQYGMDDDGVEKLRPLNMYAYSKQLFDVYSRNMKLYGIKYFNVFGPNENHKGCMMSMVARAYRQVREMGKVQLFKSYHPQYADGYQERDFLYVKDAADMTIFLGNVPEKIDGHETAGIYNCGSGIASSWIDLVKPIFEILGRPHRIEFIEMPEVLREKYQYYTRANIQKLRSIGYERPLMPLGEAVTDYIANYLIPEKRLGE
ncbi:MAG: ADP-glyceromanno-heptose 6-epimerase [Puniceicoccales bacterium]|nr:ADP-glyceromanno-heptose 6-epimerase [Puniceicoccales bacterium]